MADDTTEIPLLMLSRVTLSYDITEDRIKLAAETQQGDSVAIWLTARLLSRLLPHLQQQVDEAEPESVETPANNGSASAAGTEAPVIVEASDTQLLVTAVDVNHPEDSTVLTFRDAALAARLALTQSQLGLWLNGLEQCLAQSEWQLPLVTQAGNESRLSVPDKVTIH